VACDLSRDPSRPELLADLLLWVDVVTKLPDRAGELHYVLAQDAELSGGQDQDVQAPLVQPQNLPARWGAAVAWLKSAGWFFATS
jgi:hypothetical protein